MKLSRINNLENVEVEDWVVIKNDYEETFIFGYVLDKNVYRNTITVQCIKIRVDGEENYIDAQRSYRINHEDYFVYKNITEVEKKFKRSMSDFALDTRDKIWFYQLTN